MYPAVGCHYFLPGPRLSSQLRSITFVILLGDGGTRTCRRSGRYDPSLDKRSDGQMDVTSYGILEHVCEIVDTRNHTPKLPNYNCACTIP